MTAVPFDATPAVSSLRAELRRAVHFMGDMLDALVANRIRQILDESDHDPAHPQERLACPRRPHRPAIAKIRNWKSAAKLTASAPNKSQESPVRAGDANLRPVHHRARNARLLRRPDTNSLNDSIPVFFIGRNSKGFWVARDETASVGGIFWMKDSALRFARRTTSPAGCALIFTLETFELDTENSGNPLIGHTAFSGNLTGPSLVLAISDVGSKTDQPVSVGANGRPVLPGSLKRKCIRFLRRLYNRTAVLSGRYRAK